MLPSFPPLTALLNVKAIKNSLFSNRRTTLLLHWNNRSISLGRCITSNFNQQTSEEQLKTNKPMVLRLTSVKTCLILKYITDKWYYFVQRWRVWSTTYPHYYVWRWKYVFARAQWKQWLHIRFYTLQSLKRNHFRSSHYCPFLHWWLKKPRFTNPKEIAIAY